MSGIAAAAPPLNEGGGGGAGGHRGAGGRREGEQNMGNHSKLDKTNTPHTRRHLTFR